MEPIAHIRSDFTEKFGVPRQAGLVPELEALVVFEPAFRSREALRGIEGFSHLWLIWEFSLSPDGWSPTVRPPRLGGNERMGVFATRSPVRPNRLGLSSVALLGIRDDLPDGPALAVAGADLVDGTPILDVKPYVPDDVHGDARFGFLDRTAARGVAVEIPDEWLALVPDGKRAALRGVLAQDPRPAYQRDQRPYGVTFAGLNVRFVVEDDVLRVTEISPDDRRSRSSTDPR